MYLLRDNFTLWQNINLVPTINNDCHLLSHLFTYFDSLSTCIANNMYPDQTTP